MRPTFITNQQRITLGEIPRPFCWLMHFHQAAIGILRFACRNPLGNDCRARAFAKMDHLGSGICLLGPVSNRNRIKFAHTILAFQDTGGVFPGYGRTCFHLCPGNFSPVAPANAALGHKIIDTALAGFIARIPVLNREYLISASSIATSSTTAACS